LNAVEALREARKAGVAIAVKGQVLALRATAVPPHMVREALAANKATILAILNGESCRVCGAPIAHKKNKRAFRQVGSLHSSPPPRHGDSHRPGQKKPNLERSLRSAEGYTSPLAPA